MTQWTADDVLRIVVNPFYTLTVAAALVDDHEQRMSEDEWIATNSSALEQDPLAWLRCLLRLLQQSELTDDQTNPYHAVVIAPIFAAEHETLIAEDDWLRVNVLAVAQVGAPTWLATLVHVLQGDYVSAPDDVTGRRGAGAPPRRVPRPSRPPRSRRR
jgi:hypothetical protein